MNSINPIIMEALINNNKVEGMTSECRRLLRRLEDGHRLTDW